MADLPGGAAASDVARSVSRDKALRKRSVLVFVCIFSIVMPVTVGLSALPDSFSAIWFVLIGGFVSMLAFLPVWLLLIRPLQGLSQVSDSVLLTQEVSAADPGADVFEQLSGAMLSLSGQVDEQLQRIRGEASLFQTILDGMTEGVIVCDLEARVVLVNPAARELLELGEQDVRGQQLLEMYRSPQLKDAMDACVDSGALGQQEIVLRRGEEPVYLSLSVTPLQTRAGLEGAVAVLHDISALRRLEKVRRDFVANVSHELRTPLATITGYAETLLGGAIELEPMSRDFIETIERHGKRLSAMVSDLLVLARLEADGERAPRVAVRLSDVVVDVLDDAQPLAKSREVKLRIKRLSELPPVLADRRGLTQVLRNLFENGISYTQPGGRVMLQANLVDTGKRICVQVSDTGIGIESQHLPRIFERFYRVDEGRSRGDGGSGLGLSLVKHMVSAMGGDISVESTPGKGTNFYIMLDVSIETGKAASDADRLRY